MDLFKFTDPVVTDLIKGQPINGYSSALWVERYRTPGEFEITAPLSSGLKEFLPLGCVISHTNTLEACIVEDHQIKENNISDPVIKITGRSFESYLENRIVGVGYAFGDPIPPYAEYTLTSDRTWNQAVFLIDNHIRTSLTVDDDDSLNDDIIADTVLPASGGTLAARVVKRGTVLERLVELLAIDDIGVRFVRRNPFGVHGTDTFSYILIHAGTDRSNSVIFSWNAGELEQAEYLWSLRAKKNTALVQGRYVEEIVYTGAVNYDRRIMLVDAQDIDGSYDTVPSGGTLTSIRAKMQIRGLEALANQNEINIASTDISKITQYEYRKDYDIGDIVSVDGNYGEIEKRRVIEYVEIEDEKGESGHPTLAIIAE